MPGDYVAEGVWLARWLWEQKKKMQDEIISESERKTQDRVKKEIHNLKSGDTGGKDSVKKAAESENSNQVIDREKTENPDFQDLRSFRKETGKMLTADQKA